jgi:hypothetical protein
MANEQPAHGEARRQQMLREHMRAAIEQAAGRLATGDPAAGPIFDEVRVACRVCRGVTVFPLLPWQHRAAAPCAHCGSEV